MIWDVKATENNEKIWIMNEKSESDIKKLAIDAGITEFMAGILLDRGICTAKEYHDFLNCSTADMHDPFLFADMGKAVDRILLAVEKKEKILIYGDYDVDGVTSVSILMMFFRRLHGDVHYFIPNRKDDGYGISKDSADQFLHEGYGIMITVDCGITAVDEIDYINENGIDVILTDHHTPQKEIPKAFAVIATETADCTYPFRKLAGAGIAFKLIQALCIKMGCEHESFRYLEIVALGTVADIVPLWGENRIFVKEGLKYLANTDNRGIRAILSLALAQGPVSNIDERTLGFMIAPRINAAGRLEHAKVGVELLTAANEEEALSYAGMLEHYNTRRKEIENTVLDQSMAIIEKSDIKENRVIVLAGEDWNQGVIGIVASRLVERYNKPVILFSVKGDTAKGSGRSINGFDLFQALARCEDYLVTFGGHEQAAGVTVRTENIDIFSSAVNRYAQEHADNEIFIPKVFLSGEISPKEITLESVRQIGKLAPFGEKNRLPMLKCERMKVLDVKKIGNDKKHLKFVLEKEDQIFNAVAFNMAGRVPKCEIGSRIDVACYVESNLWNGTERVQLRIADIKHNLTAQIEKYYFDTVEGTLKYFLPEKVTSGINRQSIFGQENKKVILVFNSLESVNTYIKSMIIKKKFDSIMFVCVGGKYVKGTNYQKPQTDNIYGITLNMDPRALPDFQADYYVTAGKWFDEGYKKEVSEVLEKSGKICFDNVEGQEDREEIIISKNELRALYQFLRINCRNGKIPVIAEKLAADVSESCRGAFNTFKARMGVEILKEAGLLTYEKADGRYHVSLNQVIKNEKIDLLQHSNSFRMLSELNVTDK